MTDEQAAQNTTVPSVFAATMRKPAASPPTIPSTAGLSFKFTGSSLGVGSAAAMMTSKAHLPPPLPASLSNPFIAATGAHQASQECMRLTAAADDLRQRLKSATDRAGNLEHQLQRTQQMLSKERQDSQHQMSAVRQEVASVRDSELKLRSELASRPTVTEFKQNKFHDAVRTAMEAEEMSARVADSEARIITLGKRAEALQAEVKLLEVTRASAIEVTAANSKAMFTEEQISEKLEALSAAETKVVAAEDRLSVLADDVAKTQALVKSHKDDATKAEYELVTANEALVSAVADLTATRQEQGQTALKISELKSELVEVQGEIDATNSKAFDELTASPASFVKHCMEVTGEAAPDSSLNVPMDSQIRRIDALGCSGCGLPYHLNTDAPLSIGGMSEHTPVGGTVDDMVKAVVADLKGYLAFAVEENAKRGLAHGSATGSAIVQPIEVM